MIVYLVAPQKFNDLIFLKMWTPLTNCNKQLTIHSKLRETDGQHVKLYEITEVEFDQYKLKLLEKDNVVSEKLTQEKLSRSQLTRFNFEVEENYSVAT
jgi:hypothetical protein